MPKVSKILNKTTRVLLLALVALPLLGGVTVSAASQTSGTTINVIVSNDGIDLSLNNVNGEKNNDDKYTTTQDTATVVFEASGVGDIYIMDSNGNILFSTVKTTPGSEEIKAIFPIGDVPGTYDFTIVMENASGVSKTIPFQLILEAANLPEIPIIPNLPNLPDTGYTRLFGHVVTNRGLTSLVFFVLVLLAIAVGLFLVLIKKQTKKRSVTHHGTKHKPTRTHRSKK